MPESEPSAPDVVSSPKRRLLPGEPLDDSASDRRLVAACLKGNEQAWAALVFKYRRLIYSIPLKYGGTKEDAAAKEAKRQPEARGTTKTGAFSSEVHRGHALPC